MLVFLWVINGLIVRKKAVKKFLDANGLMAVVRAHQV
jgi:hypothetical protein